ncbi:hypothetical protein HYV89_03735 [Candidatus Woesearchaeota archaeon]|nr:hypothetical protein [Candidatus Woesearchaeota archaeon]
MKYPKFFALVLTIIIAVLIFSNEKIISKDNFIIIENYLSSFTLGVFYAYGFTAALATGALLKIADQQNIVITGIVAGFGSLLGDLIIFRFIRGSFNDELKLLGKTRPLKKIRKFLKKYSSLNKVVPIIAYIIIASPLPDEIGVSLIAVYKNTNTKAFSILAFFLNTIGIFIVLLIGRSV